MADHKKMPKGGRKGGAQFPQTPLGQAIEFARKLVAKTHTGAQPENIILKGVFNSSGPTGKVRASALKQYGLMQVKLARTTQPNLRGRSTLRQRKNFHRSCMKLS